MKYRLTAFAKKLIPIFLLNGGLSVYLNWYALNFSKSSSKYLFCTEVIRKHEFECLKAMCTFCMLCFFENLLGAA